MGNEHKGFASMDKDKQREIASKGGKAAHKKGTAYKWDSETAAAAGSIGGKVSKGGRRKVLEGQ